MHNLNWIPLLVLCPPLFGFAVYVVGRKREGLRDSLTILFSALTLVGSLMLLGGSRAWRIEGILGIGLRFESNGFSALWSVLTSFAWLGASILSRSYFQGARNTDRFQLFSLMTLGAVLGVFLSSDLYTAFVCFEVMSLSSYVLVVHNETPSALRAGQSYLAVSIVTGMVSLLGLFMLQRLIGSLDYGALTAFAQQGTDRAKLYIAGGLALCGFAAKAGLFPMHVWLPVAHPEAPAPASALLSGIIIKCGVLGVMQIIMRLFFGDLYIGYALMALAMITMLLGAVLALTSIDLKRTLAYSSMSQMGFVLLGVSLMSLLGHENTMAISGGIAHMLNHTLQKLLLFGAAGVLYAKLHDLDLNHIRGFGRNKPFLMICFLFGALSISGVPLFGGFISKTLLHDAILELGAFAPSIARVVEWLFLFAGGLTLAYMAKLFVCIFVERGEGGRAGRSMNLSTACVLGVSALLAWLSGSLPHLTLEPVVRYAGAYFGLVHMEAVTYFAWPNISAALVSIAIGALVYVFAVRKWLMRDGQYVDPLRGRFDLMDGLYRPLFTRWLSNAFGAAARTLNLLSQLPLVMMGRYIFNKDDDRTEPKQDRYFAAYPEKPFLRTGFTDTLAYSFLLMGVGLVAALLYLLFQA